MKQKKRKIPELIMPSNYDLEKLYDTDDSPFEGEEPILIEEVKLSFERNDGRTEKRV